MRFLNGIDYGVIGVYCLILVAMGILLQRKASANMEAYFLGGRKLPWWALGVSGMLNFLDMTGTMVIVSFLFILGPRGLFIEFRGGAVLVLAFMLLWTGKWHRRSNCMTGAEWMIYRFGAGPDAKAARMITAIQGVLFTFGMLAYLIKGAGLFLSMFLPYSLSFSIGSTHYDLGAPMTCAIAMVALTTLYTITAGFLGVVYTDLFQSAIVLVSVVVISVLAIVEVQSSSIPLAELAQKVTGSTEWMSTAPHLHTAMPKGYEPYEALFMFAMFYLFRNILGGMGTGADPRYFGARNERECGLLTFFWTWLMTFRWPMMMGFAVMGIFLVNNMFPDQSVLAQAATLIKSNLGDIPKHLWEERLAAVIAAPDQYPQLVDGLRQLLGGDWDSKLNLVSWEGTVNPERILPAVILMKIPLGLRGLLVVSLVAAAMSTFSPTVNAAVALFTRDIYQGFIRPAAKNFELMTASYAAGIFLVFGGFGMAYFTKSINDIWDWIIMGLGTGMAIPGLMRLYWWRFNAWGVVIGTAVGVGGAFVDRGLAIFKLFTLNQLDPVTGVAVTTKVTFFEWLNAMAAASDSFNWFKWDSRWEFLFLMIIGTLGCVIGTLVTRPTDIRVLEHFYRTTRPFGFWKRMHYALEPDVLKATRREHFHDIAAVPFALMWQITLFILPMQVIIGAWRGFFITLPIFLVSLGGVLLLWYRNLPPATDGITNGGDLDLVRSFYQQPAANASSGRPEAVSTR